MKGTLENFLIKAKKKHGERYDYAKVVYVDSQTPVTIICPEHGEFMQTPAAHIRGNGCPKCANKKRGDNSRWTSEQFIEEARKVHGDKYVYDKVEYVNMETPVTITCPEHGDFQQKPVLHVLRKMGCPKCKHRGLTRDEMIAEFRKVHGDKYDYSKFVLGKMNEPATFICPVHGEFQQSPTKHLMGHGCRKCGIESRSKNHMMTSDEFIEKAKLIHGDKYDYSKVNYTGTHNPIVIICPSHGEFEQAPNYHLNGHGCSRCGNNISTAETEIADYIKSLGIGVVLKDRTLLEGRKEVDILIPSKNIGIEYDGLIWHSDRFKDKNYHLKKTEECAKIGIRLIHIFEDEWVNKKDIVKSMLLNLLGMTSEKISARQCAVKEISYTVAADFMERNHIQGKTVSKINVGLFYLGELVSVMTFGKPRVNLGNKGGKYEYELVRFCNKLNTSVVGGAGKMFTYFLRSYKPVSVVSYCDRRWSVGNMYEKLGFARDHASQPNYFYIEGNNRKNRFRYNKAALVKIGYDKRKSEREIMEERGIFRIYDCGTYVYVWKRED